MVARVGQQSLTLAQLQTRYGLPAVEGDSGSAQASPEIEPAARDWCLKEILVQEALKSRLDQDSLFRVNLENLRRELLTNLLYQKYTPDLEIDSLQIRAEYESHLEEYRSSVDQVDLIYFLANSRESSNQVRRALQEGDELEAVLVLDPSLTGERVGWVRAEDLTPEAARSAFSLTPGGLTYPLRQENGKYLILQVKQRRLAGTVLPLSEIAEEIRNKLKLQQQLDSEKSLRDSLWAVYRPEIYPPSGRAGDNGK